MATIVEYVEGQMIVQIHEGITCDNCGMRNPLEKHPRACRCGKMMHPYTFDFSRWSPGYVVIRCTCGTKLDCTRFINTCACGQDYDYAGTELGPKEGEEISEKYAECLLLT